MNHVRARWLAGLALILLAIAEPGFSQEVMWRQADGPFGGSVWAVAVNDNNHVFVGTDGGGVFRSTDGGNHWTDVGLRRLHVRALAIDAHGHLFAGTIFDGVFRSMDNGDTWTQLNSGFANTGTPESPRYTVSSLAIDGDGRIYAGTGEDIQHFAGAGVFRSTDDGEHWESVSPGFPNAIVPAIAIRPDGTVFAATIGHGLVRSGPGGQDWAQAEFESSNVTSVAVAPAGDLYAGVDGKVYRSGGGSTNWADTGLTGTGAGIQHLTVSSRGHVFAVTRGQGLYRSTNQGRTWKPVNSGLTTNSHQMIAFDSSGTCFLGGEGGVATSSDAGRHWVERNQGLASSNVRAFAVTSAGTVFAASEGGSNSVFRTYDLGASWTSLGFGGECSRALFVDRSEAVYLGTTVGCGGDGSYQFGIYRSRDGGRTWTPINGNLEHPSVSAIVVNQQGHIFLGTGDRETRGGGSGLYRSTDKGATWTKLDTGSASPEVWTLAIAADGSILAGTGQGIFRTADNGEHWDRADAGIPDGDIFAIITNPADGYSFAAAHGYGVLRSTDNGVSWTRLTRGLADLGGALSLAINAHGTVFVAGYGGAFRSDNAGDDWRAASDGWSNRQVNSIIVTPDGYLFAGGYANSAYRSNASTTLGDDAITITGAECQGRNFIVYGERFDDGAVVWMNGSPLDTDNVDTNGDTSRQLVVRKGCKRMPPGQPVTLQVRNADGRTSREFSYSR